MIHDLVKKILAKDFVEAKKLAEEALKERASVKIQEMRLALMKPFKESK